MSSSSDLLRVFIMFLQVRIMVVSSDTSIRAVMGGNATLTMTACVGEGKWIIKKGDEYRHVITFKEETCSVEPRFQNRVQQRGTNLIISPVLFDDDGFYIYYCDGRETNWIPLHLELRTDAVVIAAGGDLSMSLCSLDQVKLNFTPRGSSAAETVFIVDNGQVFIPSQASRPMTLSVQNNTAVLSGVLEGGRVTGTDSKTGKKLFEVSVTVTGSDIRLPRKHQLPIAIFAFTVVIAIVIVIVIVIYMKKGKKNASHQKEEILKSPTVQENMLALAEYHDRRNATLNDSGNTQSNSSSAVPGSEVKC